MEDSKEHIDTNRHDLPGEDDAIVESDIELDNTDVVEPDNDPPQKVNVWTYCLWYRHYKVSHNLLFERKSCLKAWIFVIQLQMGDPSVEVTEEKRDAAQEAKSKAIDAMSEGMAMASYD